MTAMHVNKAALIAIVMVLVTVRKEIAVMFVMEGRCLYRKLRWRGRSSNENFAGEALHAESHHGVGR